MLKDIRVSCSPHISERLSTRSVMIDVIVGLAPAMAAAGYYFRIHALILIATCVISSVATEWLCNAIRKKPNSLDDFSAVVTGIILALSLPPNLPVWAAVIGSVFSVAIGKMVFGGLGANIFNPAMVGRTFLTASFGVLMTSWTVPVTIDSEIAKIDPDNKIKAVAEEGLVHARTQATPLAWSKQAIKNESGATEYNEEHFKATFMGEVGGSLGETSAIALLFGGLYLLLIRRTINFHIPLAVLLSAFVFAAIFYLVDSSTYVQPFFHLSSGGILLCAFFIATDPVTAPLTRRGMWLFGIGVGTITMLIRIVGEYPEGVMFAVLLMNAVTPLIDRLCKRIPTGGKPGTK
ncbi:MAG: RnfABCDGE type electron transport complex subunit D [Planctomycetota bacterium]|jgi:electron transport complex protein RnfD